jgi:serine/threonine-protein kinase
MTTSPDCPAPECWQALLADALPEEQREDYERHLESCPACQEQFDRARDPGAALRQLGRRLGDPTAVAADPSLARFLERMREAKDPGRTSAAEPVDLYFLRPADDPGLLGTLGVYEVRELVGQGGMGIVLKAFEPALHRVVAIKVLAPALAGSATARQRFTREAQAAAAVSHEHVVAVYSVAETDGLPYLVMQCVAGESLQQRLDRTGPLPVEEVVRIGLQTASGLAAAHVQGLIHRDIKPANLLLENGLAKVKITDFGLARMIDDVGLTQQGILAGTPEYMAPEQARGEAVDHRADLFALGCVLYACCTGRPPFRASTAMGVLRRVIEEEPTPVREWNPDVPEWLEAVILRLLAKDPAGRYQSGAEVAALLEGSLAHLRQPGTVPAPVVAPPSSTGRRARAVARSSRGKGGRFPRWPGLAALVLPAVVGMGLVMWGLAGQGPAPEPSPPARRHLVYDFRKRIDDLPGLTPFGPDAESYLRTDAQGLRITLPADRPDHNNVGIELISRIHGDFDINLGYELLDIGAPIPNPGAGVQMRLFLDGSAPMETLTRIRSPYGPQPAPLYGRVGHDGDIFAAFRLTTMANGNETGFSEGVRVRAQAPKGRLRLTRTGTRLDYVVADEDAPYCVLRSEEVGTADAETLRMFGFTGWGPVAVDVRLTDLVIDADSLPDAAPAELLPGRLAWPKAWLSAVLVGGLLFSLPLGVGLCLWARRRRAAATVPAPPAAPARPASFACPGCGTRLRARAEQAGTRVKCPRCARAVIVPEPGAVRDESPAPPGAG